MSLGWYNTSAIPSLGWTCGYCGKDVGGNVGYHRGDRDHSYEQDKLVYICPHCQNPTAFVLDEDRYDVVQVPRAPYGGSVDSLPGSVASLYAEARRCVQYTAYTSATLALRKLLMHVAVDLGAPEDGSFASYVRFLDEQHYIPPNARAWVDSLRRYGNEATHEIALMGETDAKQLLDFAEMLLRIVYEFPAKNVRT